MPLARIRLVLWGLVVIAALGGAGFFGYRALAPVAISAAGLIPPSDAIGGPFALIDQNGKPITDRDLKGKPTAMFFGFTFCPDVCPTTLSEATMWLKALGPDAAKLNVVFVTVDPERDTAEILKNYLSAFDDRILGLTGTPESVQTIIKAYRVFARRVPHGDSYLMDHTAAIYLMNCDGRFVGTINYQEETSRALTKLKALVAQS